MPSRDFYPPEFTARSRAVLDEVCAIVPGAVLIGGWGTWVRTGGPMSHDIDLILTRAEMETLGGHVQGLSGTTHLGGRKWRASLRGVHLDLHVPYESVLGRRLGLRVEALMAGREDVDGWRVLGLPGHICTKFAALLDRPESLPGEKDRHEIVGLLGQGVDATDAASVLLGASAIPPGELADLTGEAFGYLQDLELDRRSRSWLREVGNEWQHALADRADQPLAVEVEQDRALKATSRKRRGTPPAGATRAECGVWIESAAAPCVLKPRHRSHHRSRT